MNIRAGQLTAIRRHSLAVMGPGLYNSVPRLLHNKEGVCTETFELQLAKFLKCDPDQPNIDGYRMAAETNSVDP